MGCGVSRDPVPWQQIVDAIGQVIGDAVANGTTADNKGFDMVFHRALSAKAVRVFVPYLPHWQEFGLEGPTPDGEKRHGGRKTAS